MKNTTFQCLISIGLILALSIKCYGQKDVEFWFVAPEISTGVDGNTYDRPTNFRFSTYDEAATVILEQPANPLFPVQVLNIPANSSQVISFPPLFQFVENKPSNNINNFGFHIVSTAPISAYYEAIGGSCQCNPAIFSLKGRNATGTDFFVPFQTYLRNSSNSNFTPLPKAAFDIVATENNTEVEIIPTKDIVGHLAGMPFKILLNRGQTWSGESSSQLASNHPTGTKVTANKPISITMKDDLLDGDLFNGGSCRDLIGDQIIPIERTGTQYVVQKGLIDGVEKAFILATEDNTSVFSNGIQVSTLNAGQQASIDIVSGSYFIIANNPVYLLQLTGLGCETAAEVLPPLDCSGSKATRFVRFNSEPFYMFLITENGNQGSFLLNNVPGVISAGSFSPVPGSGGSFVSARIQMATSIVPVGVSTLVSNTSGLFQMGILSGQDFATGGRFGYFSDFSTTVEIKDTVAFCFGKTVTVRDSIISEPGDYSFFIGDNPMCYDTTFLVHAVQLPLTPTLDSLPLCPSDTLFLNNLVITNPGTYYDTLRATVGCDTAATYVVYGVDNPVKTAAFALCPFDSVLVDGVWYPASDTSFSYNLPAATGCDTLAEITIQVLPSPEITKNIAFCPGDTVYVDNLPYTEPDTLYNIIIPDAAGGCDTIATFVIERLPQDTSSENLTVCAGDSILVNGQWFTSDTAFSYLVPQTSLCPSVVLTAIKRLPLPEVTRTVEFCPGDTVYIQGAPYSQPDTLEIRLPSAANDCDTLATYVLQYLQPDPPAQVSIDCPADITVNADPGVGGAVVSFAEPLYGSNCPCPGLLLEQISGPNSGELFPVGATEVCFRADDNCGSSAPCCFNVTVEETDACDVKTNVCMKFELLSITRNVTGDKTYRIRVTNYCNNEMIHTAIQLPNGVNALRPANSTYYTGPSGKAYLVRNPNASPQHSIRFKTAGATGIRNGESEVFQYTLPEQSSPAYMNVTAKLWPNQTFAGHLNTFFCPVTLEPNPWNDKPAYRSAVAPDAAAAHRVSVLPNPNDGAFVLMWSGFQGETLHLRVLNAQGGLVLTEKLSSEEGARELNLPAGSPAGPYAIQVFDEQGNRSVQLFVKY